MTKRFIIGNDYMEKYADYKAFGIHDTQGINTVGENSTWGNRIVVYGSADLRDKILGLLEESEKQ